VKDYSLLLIESKSPMNYVPILFSTDIGLIMYNNSWDAKSARKQSNTHHNKYLHIYQFYI